MAAFNITSLAYMYFRLAPFILVCMFSLTSILYQDFKGLIYLAGLVLSCILATITGSSLFENSVTNSTTSSSSTPVITTSTKVDERLKGLEVCNLLTLSDAGPISKIPLSLVTFSYTAGYLLYIINHNGLVYQNLPTLIILPTLCVVDIVWHLANKCTKDGSLYPLLGAVLIGGGVGVLWSYIISRTNNSELQYFNGISNAQQCSRPTTQQFRCDVYKGGALLSSSNISK
jgi:hypothetical protein